MSYRSLTTGFISKNQKSPIRLTYSRHKPNGLDKNTLIEGLAIDVSSKHQNNNEKRIKNSQSESFSKQDIWREKYMLLQKTVKNLRVELKSKGKVISEMESKQMLQNEIYEEEKQKLQHVIENLQEEITTIQGNSLIKLDKIEKDSEKTMNSLQKEIKSLKMLHAATLSSMAGKHNKELVLLKGHLESEKVKLENDFKNNLKAKDDTIQNLKTKLADSFDESSKERQLQIDELLKELARISYEAEYVKSALKNFKSTNSDCQKCILYEEKLKQIHQDLKEKHEICKNLYSVCSKLEKQLSQQDDLLKIWNEVKKSI